MQRKEKKIETPQKNNLFVGISGDRAGEISGHRTLTNATFARENQHFMFDVLQAVTDKS